MDTVLEFRGREVRPQDVDFIRELIAASPKASRRALSFKVCEAWGWVQPNGAPCDALCRSLMLKLHRAGQLVLPPPAWTSRQPRRHAVVARIDVAPVPLAAPLMAIGPLDIRQVRRTPDEDLVKSLVQEHHYLGYVHPVGEHLKYLVWARGQPIACSPAARKANIRFVAYQSRFLILPWVQVPHLASHLLGAISRRLSADWDRVYAHPIYFTETFV